MHVTRIKQKRLQNITEKIFKGQSSQETRGGDRVSQKSIDKKYSVRDFLKKLRGVKVTIIGRNPNVSICTVTTIQRNCTEFTIIL